ncbi:MAG: heparinase II/III family protein, partial [Anaerolineaceae bacterium]|nr:heparinase II/III family protein [Anaerolineaceae bacterium]
GHTRSVRALPAEIEIEDALELNSEKQVHFHLHSSVRSVKEVAENQWQISGAGYTLTLRMKNAGRSNLMTYPYSPEYGYQHKAKELIFTSTAENLVFTLSLDKGKSNLT